MNEIVRGTAFKVQHVFIIGAKSIGQYGGYETFVNRLIGEHEDEPLIKYHVACKANGDGSMDEKCLFPLVKVLKKKADGSVAEFEYKNAHVFKIPCPNIGPAVAIYYDCAAILYSIDYCKRHSIKHPIFYILTCRIGLFIGSIVKKIHEIGGKFYLNPDGHEWRRAKWSVPIRRYWKWSERKMVGVADLIICDSVNIEKYIKSEYRKFFPTTTYIAYGADVEKSSLTDDDIRFVDWMNKYGLRKNQYYLVVGRFVPENNYETMIREFMKSQSSRDFALVTNTNPSFLDELDKKLGWRADKRIKFVGTVYDHELLKKIRECAYGYLHGHEVGGTNPSLLEALGSTELNLLLGVGFNKEVGKDCCLYWNKQSGNLSGLIDKVDGMNEQLRYMYGLKAKERIENAYSWKFIGDEYKKVWLAEQRKLNLRKM